MTNRQRYVPRPPWTRLRFSPTTSPPSSPRCWGKPVLYRSADPLDALEIAVFGDGDELGWHFDNSEFSVTVMYQQAAADGHFDYYPRLCDEHDENYPGVQEILHGSSDGVLRLPSSPGTLAVFRGQHALHRVTPVSEPRPRINSVPTYALGSNSAANRLPRAAFAAYPDRPIHLIVPFAPGGNADIVGRIVAERMSQALGQPVVVDNRGGAGGSIGAELVARATPDGYTLLVGSNGPLTVNPFVQAKLGYDPLKDFAAVVLTSYVPHVIIVNDKLEAKTLQDFIALSKKIPVVSSRSIRTRPSVTGSPPALRPHSHDNTLLHLDISILDRRQVRTPRAVPLR